jgi:hypothetical protein
MNKVQRVEQPGIPDYLAACPCSKRLLYDARTHESLVADLGSVFPSVSFNMFEPFVVVTKSPLNESLVPLEHTERERSCVSDKHCAVN